MPAGIWVERFRAVMGKGLNDGLKILVSAVQVRLLASFYSLALQDFYKNLQGLDFALGSCKTPQLFNEVMGVWGFGFNEGMGVSE